MSPLPGADWIYYACAGVLLLIALPILYSALYRDRPHGRLRCPRCWYDMHGVASGIEPPFTCPECGTVITSAKRLHRTRRRWGWATFATLLILLAAAGAATPKVRRDGFWSLWPPKALWRFVRTVPDLHWKSLDAALAELAGDPQTSIENLAWYAEYAGAFHVRNKWVKGLPMHTTRAGQVFQMGGNDISVIADAPEYYQAQPFWDTHENWWRDYTLQIPNRFSGDKAALDFILFHPRGKHGLRFTRTITLVDSIDSIMTPVTDGALRDNLRPRIVLVPTRNHPGLLLADFPDAKGPPTVYGLRAELVLGEKVVGIARWHQGNRMSGQPVYIRFSDIAAISVLPAGGTEPPDLSALAAQGCTVRFSTDEEMALADLTATHYWRGSFTLPLQDLLNPPPTK